MMEAIVIPHPLAGAVDAIASKSDAHRILVCAALADGPTLMGLRSMSQDIGATINCLRALGARIEPAGPGRFQVTPVPRRPGPCTLPCGESGSTLRFLLPVAAALGAPATLTGQGRLPQRPLGDLLRELQGHGVVFSAGQLPFTLSGALQGGVFHLPGDVSSQFITGLLLCAPLLAEGCTIQLTTPMESAGYVSMTTSAMARFGVQVVASGQGWSVAPGQPYRSPGAIDAAGDWSNAAF